MARLFFFAISALAAAALPQLFERGKFSGRTYATYSTQWLVLLGICVFIALAGLVIFILLWTDARQGVQRRYTAVLHGLYHLGFWNLAGVLVSWSAYVLLVLYRYQRHFVDFLPQVWMFWLAAGAGALFMLAFWKRTSFFSALLFVSVFFSAGIKALGYLPDVSAFPFSLEWSEASRYYYGSLPFSKMLYGFQIPLSFLHPSRYLLQSLPFLIPNSPLWLHRLWQVLLWISLSGLTGWVLARRFQFKSIFFTLAVAAWAALFLLQGPVYYHLVVCVILVLVGYDRQRFWKTMLFVVLGSLWAGISRVNWIPVPAMIVATLYLLEKPVSEADAAPSGVWQSIHNGLSARRLGEVYSYLRYLWPPLLWGVVGVLAAVGSQAAYVLVSGHEDASQFGSSFTSALLWYRLFPSPTFWLGVLPAILLVSAPVLIIVIGNWLVKRSDWHWLRVLGIGLMLLVLFVGGLVVSTKIGGGSNIHNLDAFSTLLMVVGASVVFGQYATEAGAAAVPWRPWWLVMAIILLPVVWNLEIGDPFVLRDYKQANYDLNKLNQAVQEYAPKGEILFITQRQLEMFNYIPGIKMVPDYELITLTELSMSNNQAYFDQFDQDLKQHRFALIVASRQADVLKNPALDGFAEENNAWVNYVSSPLMKYYQEKMFFDTQGIQLLVPKDDSNPAP